MRSWTEGVRTGPAYLEAVTELLQRARAAHPTDSMYEAADFHWWWRTPRPTDDLPQLFWFDGDNRPVAAIIATAWQSRTALDPLVMPETSHESLAEILQRGLEHAAAAGIQQVTLEVDRHDAAMQALMGDLGFEMGEAMIVEGWMRAADHPAISPLPDHCRLTTRAERSHGLHHLVERNGAEVESRLRQTSLYRPDLDLVVVDERDDTVAAYGLFWVDGTTSTGLVEPMRTEDVHQRQGLARHVLTSGLQRLARAGAERIKICWEPDNPAAGHLYRSVGFEPTRETLEARRTTVGSTGS